MTRRAVESTQNAVSLFPFLAVLLCTMGSLILMLIVIARQSRTEGENARRDAAAVQVDSAKVEERRDELEWEISRLAESRKKTADQLAEQRANLSHLEEHAQRLRGELAELESAERLLGQKSTLDDETKKQLQAELAELRKRAAEIEAKLAEALAKGKRPPAFAIIPFDGSGTRRRPIYIECRDDSIILQPEGLVFKETDFAGSLGPSNPLAACIRVVAEHHARTAHLDSAAQPYPLLLVRPGGIGAYYAARAAMSSWDSDFGYELIDANWPLEFPKPDPNLAQLLARTQAEARQRQIMIARAAPSLREDSPPSFHMKPDDGGEGQGPGGRYRGGGGSAAGGSGAGGGNGYSNVATRDRNRYADTASGNGPGGDVAGGYGGGYGAAGPNGGAPNGGARYGGAPNGGGANGTGPNLEGAPGGNGPGGYPPGGSAVGGVAYGGGPGNGGGSGNGGGPGNGVGTANGVGSGIGGGPVTGDLTQSGEPGNGFGMPGSPNGGVPGGSVPGGVGPNGSGSLAGGPTNGGLPGGGQPGGGAGSGAYGLPGGGDPNAGTMGGAAGSGGPQLIAAGPGGGGPGLDGQGSGSPGAGGAGSGSPSGNQFGTSNFEQPPTNGNGPGGNGAGGNGSTADASGGGDAGGNGANGTSGGPNGGASNAPGSYAGSSGPGGSANFGGQAGSQAGGSAGGASGAAGSSAGGPGGSPGGTAGGASSSAGRSGGGPGGMGGGAPSVNFGGGPSNSAAPPPPGPSNSRLESLARKRGENWGLPDAARKATPLTRPLQVYCSGDRLTVLSDRGVPDRQINLGPRTEDCVDELVSTVWGQIESWGIAGRGMYWRPVLSVHYAPDGAGRFDELKTLLAGSGLEVTGKPIVVSGSGSGTTTLPRR